jgi:hypothetical protein
MNPASSKYITNVTAPTTSPLLRGNDRSLKVVHALIEFSDGNDLISPAQPYWAVDFEQLRVSAPLQRVLRILQIADARHHLAAPGAREPALHGKCSADLSRINAVKDLPLRIPDFEGGDLLAEGGVLQQPAQVCYMLWRQRVALRQLLNLWGDEAIHIERGCRRSVLHDAGGDLLPDPGAETQHSGNKNDQAGQKKPLGQAQLFDEFHNPQAHELLRCSMFSLALYQCSAACTVGERPKKVCPLSDQSRV